MKYEIGSLVKTRYTGRIGVVIQQGEAVHAHKHKTQVLLDGEPRWILTHELSFILGVKHQIKLDL